MLGGGDRGEGEMVAVTGPQRRGKDPCCFAQALHPGRDAEVKRPEALLLHPFFPRM